jgi:hypothetical protein
VHPELLKFKLEKRARILGKIGGVPAFGPGVVMPQVPSGGPGLRATGSAAAREMHYSKMEGRDARWVLGGGGRSGCFAGQLSLNEASATPHFSQNPTNLI